MLVPRVYGLGDLSQILDHRAYDQTKEILDSIGDELKKFVATEAHRKAAHALMEKGFVLLLGEPASGKSMIAAVLAVGANDRWNCLPVKVTDAADFNRYWNPNDSRQFFWVDDVFGTTQYQPEMTASWNRHFGALSAAIRKGARVLFTSRDYIFRAARRDIKESAFPLLAESQVIIDVQALQQDERDQIVYNRIKLGDQTKEFKRSLKGYLPIVSHVSHFLPEIARRLGSQFFTQNLIISAERIRAFSAHPVEVLNEILRGLSNENRAALALVFMNGGSVPSPVEFSQKERTAIERLGGTPTGVLEGLNYLNGSLVKLERVGGLSSWAFKHPTIRDAFATIVSEDPELVDIYLQGTPFIRIMDEVTCGSIGLSGVKVIVPESRFAFVSDHLDALRSSDDEMSAYRAYNFLASRCSGDFLRSYLMDRQDIFEAIANCEVVHAVGVDLLVRLGAFGLLPEATRRQFVETIVRVCVDDPTQNFLVRDDVKSLLSEDELSMVKEVVKRNIVENLQELIWHYEGEFTGGESPDEHFADLRYALESYKSEFAGDEETVMRLEHGLADIEEAIDRMEEDMPREPDYEDDEQSWHREEPAERNIFDDVDE
ncbi:MAG: hypothetical protein ACLQU2_31640 [Candidatus Binataceae bacterium]